MRYNRVGQFIGSVAAVTCALAIAAPQVQAGQLYNGWNYGIDAFNDGSGGVDYDIKGLAVKDTTDSIFVAFSGGLGVEENSSKITWGDLFFNFSGQDFKTASEEGSLVGIKFANNDSGLTAGLYSNAGASNIVNRDHNTYSSLKAYYNSGFNKSDTYGTDLNTNAKTYQYLYGDAVAQNPTTSNTPLLNVIGSGTWLGGFDLLDLNQLTAEGLNFGYFNANAPQIFGLKLDKSLLAGVLPGGITPFMAHIMMECGNDGVALAGNIDVPNEKKQEVPEPTSLLGLGVVGLAFWRKRKRRQA